MPRLYFNMGGPITGGLSLLLLLSPVAQGFQLSHTVSITRATIRGQRGLFTGSEAAGRRLYAGPTPPQSADGHKEFETHSSPKKGGGGNSKNKASKGGSSSPPSPREKPQYVGPAAKYNPREAAYLAALAADREQCYMSEWLEQWRQLAKPTTPEMALALLLSSVACREALSLDYALGQLNAQSGPVKLKARQRVILRVGLAAYRYCTRIPLHATVDSTVELAKKYGGGQAFGNFCNAVLRKLPPDPRFDNEDRLARRDQAKATAGEEEAQGVGGEANMRRLPLCEVTDEASLSIATSHPPFLVSLLVKDLGSLDAARKVLEAGNSFPPTMARTRPNQADTTVEGGEVPKGARLCTALPSSLQGPALPYSLYTLPRGPSARTLSSTGAWYVTNGTPASLIARLTHTLATRQHITAPTGLTKRVIKVLDLCAAPGGKGLAVLDIFAKLEAEGEEGVDVEVTFNDVSEEKLELVQDNLRRFNLQGSPKVKLSMGDGAHLKGAEGGYDVVIVDAPCSNTGVLSRRPEARWRLRNDDLLFELEATQRGLLEHAVSLLDPDNPHAEVWYMTCSILKREDEDMAAHACKTLGLEMVPGLSMKVLPGEVEGFDGGYAACLRKKQE